MKNSISVNFDLQSGGSINTFCSQYLLTPASLSFNCKSNFRFFQGQINRFTGIQGQGLRLRIKDIGFSSRIQGKVIIIGAVSKLLAWRLIINRVGNYTFTRIFVSHRVQSRQEQWCQLSICEINT